MKKFAFALALAATAFAAQADNPHGLPPGIAKKMQGCQNCGMVESVVLVKRKGEGGAVGIVGGAVVGGLLGNQIGGGTGKTIATVGGAVAGGFAGNEVQKHVTSKEVWVTKVKMKDGSIRTFEQEQQPGWKYGQAVRVDDKRLVVF